MTTHTVQHGDALGLVYAREENLPAAPSSIACCVTSPPYWGLNDHGDDPREFGKGDLDLYIQGVVTLGRGIHRMLDDAGVLWLNIGDTMSGSGGAGGDWNKGGSKEGNMRKWKQGKAGIEDKQQCMVPFLAAHALQHDFIDGDPKRPRWYLRKVIVWDQLNLRPEDVRHAKRPLFGHEYIFMLSKSQRHRWNAEPLRDGTIADKGDVWRFKPESKKRGSRAFPIELPRRCILLTCHEGDTVLDPFMGTGTTADAARELRCNSVGLELYPKDVEPKAEGDAA